MNDRRVTVDFRKWMTRPHWRFDMYHLADDPWGTWLWTPPGSTARRASEPARTFDHLNVKLVSPDSWWTAIWNDSGHFDLYVDIIAPAAWSGNRVTMIDLDLDIIRRADGTVLIEDEDEFANHQTAFGYPEEVIAKARRVTNELRDSIAVGAEPFSEVGAGRMAEAAQLATAGRRP